MFSAKTTVAIETVAMDSVGELKGDFPTSPLSRPSLRKSSSSEPELNSVFKNAEDKGFEWLPIIAGLLHMIVKLAPHYQTASKALLINI